MAERAIDGGLILILHHQGLKRIAFNSRNALCFLIKNYRVSFVSFSLPDPELRRPSWVDGEKKSGPPP